MTHWWVRGLSCKPNIYVSDPHLNLGWGWYRETGLSPPVKYFDLPFQGDTSFVDCSCYFCLVFVIFSCASVCWWLVVTCWERADAWLLFWCLIVNLLPSHCYPGSVWYLIVLIPDLCPLSYFKSQVYLIIKSVCLWYDLENTLRSLWYC